MLLANVRGGIPALWLRFLLDHIRLHMLTNDPIDPSRAFLK
jgi:hypothetical protein